MEQPKKYERSPIVDLKPRLSNDGRYWIFTRMETWILPRKYLDVIAQNHGKEAAAQAPAAPAVAQEKPGKKVKRNAQSSGQGN
ncbi:hypothetical protein FACS1894126_1380 [Alphaproteobacteria bacterium]|jgi:hypothetical protein|nr:hypothetical protein FACS1894126_1380 [Alphaproteobacteria bacterium]